MLPNSAAHPDQEPAEAPMASSSHTSAGGQRSRRHRGWRAVALAAAMLLLLVGAAFAWLAWLQGDSGGYFNTPPHRFSTPSVALKSDEVEVDASTARAGDPQLDVGDLGRVRVQVRSADPFTETFVGVGPKAAVEAYLRGSAYDEFASAELQPFRPTFRSVPGSTSASPPADQTFWVATAAGAGSQTLEWNKAAGTWSIVIMRVDGQAGIEVDASVGLRFGFLTPAVIGALACGALLLAFLLHKRYRKDGQADVRPTDTSASAT